MRHAPPDLNPTKKQNDALRKRREAADKALQAMMNQPDFRSFMHQLLADCHFWSSVTHGHAVTAAAMTGRRDLGLVYYRRLMRLCPEFVARMEQEHISAFRAISELEQQDAQ
jgi:hypothetical protein